MLRFVCFLLLLLVLVVPQALAAGPANGGAAQPPEDEEAEPVVEEKPMTQGELAVAIVRMLGLESEIDENIGGKATFSLNPDVTKQIYADFLTGRGVRPLGGWKINEEVTDEVLAVVVTQVTGLISEIETARRDDAAAYIEMLESRGIILTSVRDVLSEIEIINQVVDIPGLAGPYFDNLTPIRGF